MTVIATLVLALALQDTETVPKGLGHRELYDDLQKEYQKAQDLAEKEPKAALELIDAVFRNPRIGTKDRRLAFTGPGGGIIRTVDFFPHLARGRIELALAGQVRNDPQAVSILLSRAIADFKSSADAGVKLSERLLAAAEELQKKSKPASKTPDPPKEARKEPTKDTAAEQAFREAWFKLIEDHRFRTAREYIDTKGGSLSADRKHDFIAETEDHCQKYVQGSLEAFLTALHGAGPLKVRQMAPPEFQRDFGLPAETEVVGVLPVLEWCRKERAALDRLRQTEARAPVEQAMPVLDGLLGAMVSAEPLERTHENRWLKDSWQFGFRYVEEVLQGLAAAAKEGTPDVRRQSRASADQVRARWSEAIARVPRESMVRNGVHGHPKQIQGLMDQFPIDSSDLDRMDLDACFTADSPDQALEQMISDLTRLRNRRDGPPLSKDSSRKLLTDLVAATAMHDLLAGKGVEEVTRSLGELSRALAKEGGALDPDRWGPKIEKILTTPP